MSQPESSLQAETEARLRFETLLADLSGKFISVPAAQAKARMREAMALGADAYVVKSCLASDLLPAVTEAMAGRTFVSASTRI
jgi:DNA-binding NarL/FixJ family response regulator